VAALLAQDASAFITGRTTAVEAEKRGSAADWPVQIAYLIQYGVWRVTPFLQTFKEYPPNQRSASFSIDQMVDALMKNLDKTGAK
jgi:hypothetical protein